jgi:NADPH-dependent 2,4-dienoyl-CoA reductase/sulfur reductase-like enzyme
MDNKTKLTVIGAGPAGLSAAAAAAERGVKHVTIIDRHPQPGGLLPQCTHKGFGLKKYGEELTGPEYAQRLIHRAIEAGVKFRLNEEVTNLVIASEAKQSTAAISGEKSITILATGCRERPIGALPITGTRPAGIFTAGAAQHMINISGLTVGKRAVILGAGDIGMIVARLLVQKGTEVVCVAEQNDKPSGIAKYNRECLDAYKIPLLTNTTITKVEGETRLESVTLSDKTKIPCDTLIISAGLIPERELLSDTGFVIAGSDPQSLTSNTQRSRVKPGMTKDVIICGNAKKILTYADDIAGDGERAGNEAADIIITH